MKQLTLITIILSLPFTLFSQAVDITPPTGKGLPPLTANVHVTEQRNTQLPDHPDITSHWYTIIRNSVGLTRIDTPTLSVISDPQARKHTVLDHRSRTATVTFYFAGSKTASAGQTSLSVNLGRTYVPKQEAGTPLGDRKIDGYLAHGSRLVTSDGRTTEVWRSKEFGLPLHLETTRVDGVTTVDYTDVRKGEPDPSLFAIPADYVMKQKNLSSDSDKAVGVIPGTYEGTSDPPKKGQEQP